jgi:hypothetical protein
MLGKESEMVDISLPKGGGRAGNQSLVIESDEFVRDARMVYTRDLKMS